MIYTLAQTTHAHHTHLKTTPTPVSANPCTTHMRAHKAPNNASSKDKTKRATRTRRTTTNTDTQRKKRPQRKAYSSEHCNKSVLAMIIKHVPVHQNRRHKRDKKRGTSEKKTEAQARCRPHSSIFHDRRAHLVETNLVGFGGMKRCTPPKANGWNPKISGLGRCVTPFRKTVPFFRVQNLSFRGVYLKRFKLH